jgi:hypothetical protein
MDGCTPEPLAGRARPYEGRGVHLFGTLASPSSSTGFLQPTKRIGRWAQRGAGDCCGLWMIETTIVEIIRGVSEIPLTPLPDIDFGNGVPLPTGAVRVRNRGQLKLVVNAEMAASDREFFMDTNQTLEVSASCICGEYFVPENFVDVTQFTAAELAAVPAVTGLVVDAMLYVAFTRLEQSVGDRECTYTTHLHVPADTSGVIPIPPFATEVTIYQDTQGAASAQWTQWIGDPSVGLPLQIGTIPWVLGQRKTLEEIVLPDATHLQTDQDVDQRFFTMRWTIRP